MKCEQDQCINEVPEDNVGRVCAYQYEPERDTHYRGHWGATTCNCCDECRYSCHEALIEAYAKVDTVIKDYSDKRPMVKDEQWQEGFINGYVIGRELNEKSA